MRSNGARESASGGAAASGGGGAGGGAAVLRWVGRLVLVAALGGGLYALGYGGWRFVTSSPRFNVDDVRVEAGGKLRHLDRDDLVRKLGVVGRNVFAIDTDAVARVAESEPWVRSAEVTRVLPSILVVKVREER